MFIFGHVQCFSCIHPYHISHGTMKIFYMFYFTKKPSWYTSNEVTHFVYHPSTNFWLRHERFRAKGLKPWSCWCTLSRRRCRECSLCRAMALLCVPASDLVPSGRALGSAIVKQSVIFLWPEFWWIFKVFLGYVKFWGFVLV